VFALGARARLVGRSRYCDYPPEVSRVPSVGGFVDASFEAILALAPDLVMGVRGPGGRALHDRLNARGIATYFPHTDR
jgi:iron complex transport system substrate-binding protein